jgi:hypothetical protein
MKKIIDLALGNLRTVFIAIGLLILIFGGFRFKKWFENKFQIPYAIEYAQPARDSLKVAQYHIYILSLESDSLLQRNFRMEDKIKTDSLVIIQNQKSIKALLDFKKTSISEGVCWKYPCIGKPFIINCKTGERL